MVEKWMCQHRIFIVAAHKPPSIFPKILFSLPHPPFSIWLFSTSPSNVRVVWKKKNPTTNGGMQNGSSVENNAYTFLHFWCRFVCSVSAFNNFFASELSRKFIKSVLLVGKKKKKKTH